MICVRIHEMVAIRMEFQSSLFLYSYSGAKEALKAPKDGVWKITDGFETQNFHFSLPKRHPREGKISDC